MISTEFFQRRGYARRMNSTRRLFTERITDDAKTYPAPGLRWSPVDETVLPLQRRYWLAAIRGSRSLPPNACMAATMNGSISFNATSFPCPTSGNTPGSPHGTWRFIAFRWHWSTQILPRTAHLCSREWYLHPNGQIPAYEWSFGDVNPPVQAWAAWQVYQIDASKQTRRCDTISRAGFPQAADQFYLVGQPQGCRGEQHFPGRLSGIGQHRRIQPQQPLADRWSYRPGRWHWLDGHVLLNLAGHRPGIGADHRL